VAALLLVLGLLFIVGHRWQVMLAAGLVIAAGSALAFNQGWLHGPCLRETNYFCIKIREEERDGETVRILILDRLVHSYTSLADPTKLVYGYEKVYAEITAYRARHDNQLRALFIGGGGYTFPRYMEAIYPNSDIDVIEIDPGVTQVAHDWLGLSPETRITTFNQDARLFLEQTPSNRYDLILGDAFNDFSVPYHLTTKEFNDRVEAWLVDDGLYLVNMIDGVRGDFLRAYVHTLRQNFRYVYLAPATASWRISPRTTFVLIGTNAPLELLEFTTIDAGDGEALLAGQVLSQAEVDDFLAKGQVVLLTDEYAPVDQMLAPVVRGEE
jgi:spermidine synthase